MTPLDLFIIATYLIAMFAWAMYIGRRETADGFFVFSRKAPFFLVLFSIVSTWVGVGTTVATAASGYETGISLGATAVAGGIVGALAAAWFAPFLKRFGDRFRAYTLGDFFVARYSPRAGRISGAAVLVVYLLMTAAQFVGLAALVDIWTGIEFESIVFFAAISTIIYTAFAGIKSDFYTDFVHFLVMFVVLFLVLLPIVLRTDGGVSILSTLPSDSFDIFAYGGVSFFIAGLIFGAGSVFVTMELWQRIYAASSERAARYALGASIGIIVLFYAVSTFFGLMARVLLPDLGNSDQALFMLMNTYLPVGLLGVGVAAFMAIFISSLNSTLMVSAATLTKDFYKGLYNRTAGDRTLLGVGRIMTAVAGGIAMLIAYALPDFVSLSVNSIFMLLVLLPAVIGGFFWKQATERAAFFSVLSGLVTVVAFLFLDHETAFVPGFVVSLFVFVLISKTSQHNRSENLEIVEFSAEKPNAR